MGAILDRISWGMAVVLAALVGLAPIVPAPHVWQKLNMLVAGELTQLVDMGDLAMHGLPWLLLAAKAARVVMTRQG